MSAILDAIETKKAGGDLDDQAIAAVVTGYTCDEVPDYQMSALLMAIFLEGMSYEETLALHRPMRLHLTLVHAEIAGDTYFPEWRDFAWRELDRREGADANFRYTFFTLER